MLEQSFIPETAAPLRSRLLVAIDPGATGAICWSIEPGEVSGVVKMPETTQDIVAKIGELADQMPDLLVVYIERVGAFRPSGGYLTKRGKKLTKDDVAAMNRDLARVPAWLRLVQHYGELRGCLASRGFRIEDPTPAVWMKAIAPQAPKGMTEALRAARKKHIKGVVQDALPAVAVYDWNADALGLMLYAMLKEIGRFEPLRSAGLVRKMRNLPESPGSSRRTTA